MKVGANDRMNVRLEFETSDRGKEPTGSRNGGAAGGSTKTPGKLIDHVEAESQNVVRSSGASIESFRRPRLFEQVNHIGVRVEPDHPAAIPARNVLRF